MKLNAIIRRDKNAKEEKLYLVAKTMANSEGSPLSWSEMLKKEVFVYLELIPAYRNIEREAGVSEKELIDLLPKYFGHRYSLDLNSEEVDKHATLLMENLAMRGYSNGDKRKGNFLDMKAYDL